MLTQQPLDGQALEHVLLRRGSTLAGNGRLGSRDPQDAPTITHGLGPDDRLALRVAAAGLGPVGTDRARRGKAIDMLGRLHTVEDLNMLFALARSEPDPEVRAAALLSLARTGLTMVAPVLRNALASGDPMERGAAEKGIALLAADVGPRAVLAAIRPPVGVGRLVRTAESLLLREAQKLSADKPRRTRRDPM